jgi:hypothetical protein
MKIGGFREVTLRRDPECGEEREECGFELGSGVVGFNVKHRTLWLRRYCVRSKGKQRQPQPQVEYPKVSWKEYNAKGNRLLYQAAVERKGLGIPWEPSIERSNDSNSPYVSLLTKIDKIGKNSGVRIS